MRCSQVSVTLSLFAIMLSSMPVNHHQNKVIIQPIDKTSRAASVPVALTDSSKRRELKFVESCTFQTPQHTCTVLPYIHCIL